MFNSVPLNARLQQRLCDVKALTHLKTFAVMLSGVVYSDTLINKIS